MVNQDKRLFKEMLKVDAGYSISDHHTEKLGNSEPLNVPSKFKAKDLQALSNPVDENALLPPNLSPSNYIQSLNFRQSSESSDVEQDHNKLVNTCKLIAGISIVFN